MAWWKKDEPKPHAAAPPSIPTAAQFRADILTQYQSTAPTLVAPLLEKFAVFFERLYSRALPKTSAAYRLMVDTCVESLVAFTKAAPTVCHASPHQPSVFSYRQSFLTLFIADPITNKPQQAARVAFGAFVAPFTARKQALKAAGAFNWDDDVPDYSKTYPKPLGTVEDHYGKPSHEITLLQHNNWIDRKLRHTMDAVEYVDKQRDAAYSKIDEFDSLFLGTPLFRIAFNLVPTGSVLVPFPIPEQTRYSGMWIVAPPGRGKTNLLHHLLAQDRPHGTVILMDSKGDLINSYKGIPGSILIDPATVAINPLQLGSSTRSIEFLEYIFSALLETGMTALQKTLFRSVLSLLLKVPNATLETFRQILTTGWKPFAEYMPLCDQPTQEFFTAKPAEFDAPTYKETKMQVLWRLRLILSNEYLRQIFTVPKSNIDFFKLLDSRKLIIIDNSKDILGEDGSEFFGRFFIAILWMAAVSRSRLRPEDKIPVYVYLDECADVIKRDEKIATILDQCRSQKIALTMAHQRIAQIVSPNVLDALGNCAIRIANSDDDAAALSPRFRTPPENLRQPVGTFAIFVRDRTPSAVIASVTEFDLSKLSERTHTLPPQPPREPPRPPEEPPEPSTYDLEWEATLSPKMAEQGGAKAIHGLTVRIIPGTKDGTRVRLKGKGARKPDGTFGDAYITYSVVTRPDQPTLGYYDDETDAKPW